MTSFPLVSIIVPTRNRPGETVACVQSVRAQSYKNIEILVVDGNSTDNTREAVTPFANRVIMFPKTGDHRCAQRNLGVKNAKGEYVLIIDSDMTLTKNVIRECVEKMESNPTTAGLVIPEQSFGQGFWAQCKALEKEFYQGVPWMEAARFYQRELYLKLGGYNPALTSGEDWDISQRASEHGHIDRIQSYIRHNEGRITLWSTMKKKYYYASKFAKYANTTESKNISSQTNIFHRYALFFKKPSLILRHPLRWVGMVAMKTGEFGAGTMRYLLSKNYKDIHKTTAIIDSNDLPFVSYIIPTFNAEKYLRRCLESVITQGYPQNKYEILVADGGSTDTTLDILRDYKIIPISNPKRIAEYGKYLAYEVACGDIICLLDSDNIIASNDWLKKMVIPLIQEPSLIGVESNYLIASDFTSINTYANLLIIVDPLARILASKPVESEVRNGYMVKHFGKGSVPVSGANGFLWRKNIIKKYIDIQNKTLEEVNLMSKIAKENPITYANIPNVGIYHYYCTTLSDYISKRKKIARKFLGRKSRDEVTWVDKGGEKKLILSALYLGTVVGPTLESIIYILRSRKAAWLWHPLVSFLTIVIYIFYKYRPYVRI